MLNPTFSAGGRGRVLETEPSFTRKLFDIINLNFTDIICWCPDGLSFEVRDPKRLELEILPKYFRHGKFQSLTRQLNFYAFKKVSRERSSWVYSHEFFQRNRPELLESLRRRTNYGANAAAEKRRSNFPNEPSASPNNKRLRLRSRSLQDDDGDEYYMQIPRDVPIPSLSTQTRSSAMTTSATSNVGVDQEDSHVDRSHELRGSTRRRYAHYDRDRDQDEDGEDEEYYAQDADDQDDDQHGIYDDDDEDGYTMERDGREKDPKKAYWARHRAAHAQQSDTSYAPRDSHGGSQRDKDGYTRLSKDAIHNWDTAMRFFYHGKDAFDGDGHFPHVGLDFKRSLGSLSMGTTSSSSSSSSSSSTSGSKQNAGTSSGTEMETASSSGMASGEGTSVPSDTNDSSSVDSKDSNPTSKSSSNGRGRGSDSDREGSDSSSGRRSALSGLCSQLSDPRSDRFKEHDGSRTSDRTRAIETVVMFCLQRNPWHQSHQLFTDVFRLLERHPSLALEVNGYTEALFPPQLSTIPSSSSAPSSSAGLAKRGQGSGKLSGNSSSDNGVDSSSDSGSDNGGYRYRSGYSGSHRDSMSDVSDSSSNDAARRSGKSSGSSGNSSGASPINSGGSDNGGPENGGTEAEGTASGGSDNGSGGEGSGSDRAVQRQDRQEREREHAKRDSSMDATGGSQSAAKVAHVSGGKVDKHTDATTNRGGGGAHISREGRSDDSGSKLAILRANELAIMRTFMTFAVTSIQAVSGVLQEESHKDHSTEADQLRAALITCAKSWWDYAKICL